MYVELLDEGVEVWRPVDAEAETDHIVASQTRRPATSIGRLGLQAASGANGATWAMDPCSWRPPSFRDASARRDDESPSGGQDRVRARVAVASDGRPGVWAAGQRMATENRSAAEATEDE